MINFTPKFRREIEKGLIEHETVSDYMTRDLISFTPEQNITEVIETIIAHKISGAPVVNSNQELVGIISEKDCLRVLLDDVYHNLPPSERNVSNYMSKKVVTVDDTMDVVEVANLFLNSNFRRYPVVRSGKLVGLVSRRDILRASKTIKKTSW
ncbi:MAG: CBS domain-containing protein [Crocinitomicaceae bacterium]|jgi:CBS domain-containing protein|nr:CBS domain-containing protein [Crocinitomicaceae bacterium]MBT6514551.1 CBS domain-containing protein [Crocinitomicaceae bacterium]